jgi:hypothetical protein
MLTFSSPFIVGCSGRVRPSFSHDCGLGRAPSGARGHTQTHVHRASPARMQLPPHPAAWTEPPLTEEQRGPDTYIWDPNYVGTMHPGLGEPDCFPLDEVMTSGVYERMVYQELDRYERSPEIFQPDEDLLEWLVTVDRLLPRGMDDAELEMEAEKQVAGITEEDLEFGEEDSRTLAYYSRQGEGSSLGASPDFGGLAESGLESMLE